jgi:general secretion pathway protein N
MVRWTRIIGLALLSGATLTGRVPDLLAATSATLDILPDETVTRPADAQPANAVDVGTLRPVSRPNREDGKPLPSGNPLWAVPLSVLSATQQRPIFSASRRPPQRAVVATDPVAAPAPQKAAEPEHPPLTLIGAVVGDNDAIAVFIDRASQKIVRLRQGETYAGWALSSALRREVTLKKADRTEVLVLPRPDSPQPAPGPGTPGLAVPVAGAADGSYAPFIPRSTPKNGEPDGL